MDKSNLTQAHHLRPYLDILALIKNSFRLLNPEIFKKDIDWIAAWSIFITKQMLRDLTLN